MREDGPVRFRFEGDAAAAQGYAGQARTLLGILKNNMRLGGLQQLSGQVTLSDGATVFCQSMFGQDTIKITAPQGELESYEEPVTHDRIPLDAYVLIGDLLDSVTHARTAVKPEEKFHEYGVWFPGATGLTLSVAIVLGSGYCMTLDGANHLLVSRTLGKTATTVATISGAGAGVGHYASVFLAPGVVDTGSGYAPWSLMVSAAVTMSGGWTAAAVLRSTDAGGTWQTYSMLNMVNYINYTPTMYAIGRTGTILALHFVAHTAGMPATSPVFGAVSSTYGATWGYLNMDSVLSGFLGYNETGYNSAVVALQIQSTATVMSKTGKVFGVLCITKSDRTMRYRPFTLQYGSLQVLTDWAQDAQFLGVTLLATGDGCLLRVFGGRAVAQAQVSADYGQTWTEATLPTTVSGYLGIPTIGEDGQVLLPMYDGTAYRLARSRDKGVTWRIGPQIVGPSTVAAPATDGGSLPRFSECSWVGTGSDPAPVNPVFPWVTDPRIAVPV